jgi:imidazolonepropionase
MLLRDIGKLLVVPPGPLAGARMRNVPALANAALLARDGKIAWFGPASQAPCGTDEPSVSARGGCVIPGLIDSHTHLTFAGERSGEFVRRVAGESYASIMQSGGGIRVTCDAVRRASEEELIDLSRPRLRRMLTWGVTTCECKSGYGLAVEHELKQLRAVRALRAEQPIELLATFLGAHAVPAEFHGRPDDYLDEVCAEDVMRRIGAEGLAGFCDVFCDSVAFDVPQARRVLERARRAGLKLKLHADQISQIGASRLAAEVGAVSADHLEMIDEGGVDALLRAGVIATVLPGCSFFLGVEHCDARRLIRAGLPVALATDLNPGSSHIESLPLVMNIACCQLRMLPEETLTACTANAAAALGLQGRLGAIAVGFDADLVTLDARDLADWLYTPGRNRVQQVIKRGALAFEASGQ